MGVQAQSALLASILLLALGINVAFQERRVELRWSFIWLVGAFWLYNLSFFLGDITGSLLWRRGLLVAGVGISITSMRFFGRYMGRRLSSPIVWSGRGVAPWLALAGALIVLSPLAESALITVLVAALASGSYGYAHWQLYRGWRAAQSPTEYRRMRYLVVGGAISVGTSVLDLLPASGVPFPSLGHMFTTVYLYFWSQVIQRERLLDLREQLGRGLAMLLQASAATLVYLGLVSWVGEKFGLFVYNSFVVGVVLFFIWEPSRRAVDLWVSRLLFREREGFELAIRRLERELSSVIGPNQLSEVLMRHLEESGRVTHASLYLLEEDGLVWQRMQALGPNDVPSVHVLAARPFLDALRARRVLAHDEIERELDDLEELTGHQAGDERAQGAQVLAMLEQLHAGLCFAMLSGERLLGFLCLHDERLREAFSSHELNLVAQVVRQATTVMENSALFGRLKERERLTIIGEMAAGMAHEIRNPLGAIKAAAQLLSPEQLDLDERELVDVIVEEADRLNLVLSQFLDYTRPYQGKLERVLLGPILERAGVLLRAKLGARPIKVVVSLDSDLPAVLGDADRLLQVLLNLGENACDAMPEEGRLRLSAALERGPAQGTARVCVQVQDTGQGMSPEQRRSLFIPFFTTKKGGTGLGLAISERIVQQHGDRIRVQSTLGEGTQMRFYLAVAR